MRPARSSGIVKVDLRERVKGCRSCDRDGACAPPGDGILGWPTASDLGEAHGGILGGKFMRPARSSGIVKVDLRERVEGCRSCDRDGACAPPSDGILGWPTASDLGEAQGAGILGGKFMRPARSSGIVKVDLRERVKGCRSCDRDGACAPPGDGILGWPTASDLGEAHGGILGGKFMRPARSSGIVKVDLRERVEGCRSSCDRDGACAPPGDGILAWAAALGREGDGLGHLQGGSTPVTGSH